MTHAARSVLVFSIYLFVLGGTLVTVPNALLSVFRIPPTSEVWIRVVGVLVLVLGLYYAAAARRGLEEFFRLTVPARGAVLVFFVAFVLLGLAPPVLALFGAVDAAAACWTALALRSAGADQASVSAGRGSAGTR
jgi:F0F1-type ATP synthase membrane subunit a